MEAIETSPGQRESRLRRFGLGLGIATAIVLHAGIFMLPAGRLFGSKEGELRRGLVARAYRPGVGAGTPAPQIPEGERMGTPARHEPRAPEGKLERGAAAWQPAGPPVARIEPETGTIGALRSDPQGAGEGGMGAAEGRSIGTQRTGLGMDGVFAVPRRAEDQPPSQPPTPPRRAPAESPDRWKKMMADLEERRQGLGDKEAAIARAERAQASARKPGRGGGGRGSGAGGEGDGYLDPRIRMNVVSYPSSSIEKDYYAVPYPDLRVQRKNLQAGICRVYYRVWTDGSGRIVRTQIKTPETQTELQRYKVFVDEVIESVRQWPFPRQQAEVHIDVLFEIE